MQLHLEREEGDSPESHSTSAIQCPTNYLETEDSVEFEVSQLPIDTDKFLTVLEVNFARDLSI